MSPGLAGILAIILCAVLFSVAPGPAWARSDVAALCDAAARTASAESGVPLDVLRSISLTETGRRSNGEFLPWPWTVNMEGAGKWFDTHDEALRYVERNMTRGARSFDVGCFQINYRWHGEAFASVEDMFDPVENARYAARFLGELKQEYGDWSRAAGAFHSRTPGLAKRYAARFDRIRAQLPEAPAVLLPDEPTELALADVQPQALPPVQMNRYPFLKAGSRPVGLASLVPDGGQPAQRFLPLGGAAPVVVWR